MTRQTLLPILLLGLLASPLMVRAEELPAEQAVEAGRDTLAEMGFPWYDSSADDVKRIDVAPPKDLKNRDSKWEAKPKKKKRSWAWPDWLSVMLEVLGWTLLVIALIGVGYLLVRAFLAAEAGGLPGASTSAEDLAAAGDIDRVESLPFQLKAPQTDLLSEARRHYEAGNYADAIVYFYSYQLVELDKHQMIRLTKGKTNRQYLREVRRREEVSDLLRRTMLAFEDVFFGNHTLDRHRFESCWNGLDAFHHSLEHAPV